MTGDHNIKFRIERDQGKGWEHGPIRVDEDAVMREVAAMEQVNPSAKLQVVRIYERVIYTTGDSDADVDA